jgi:hypothetical protein
MLAESTCESSSQLKEEVLARKRSAHRRSHEKSGVVILLFHLVVSAKSGQILGRRVINRREHYSRTSQPSDKNV